MTDHNPSGTGSTQLPRADATSRRATSSVAQRGHSLRCDSIWSCSMSVDRIEGKRGQEVVGLVVGDHASTPRIPASTSATRMCCMPFRILLLIVPSGCPKDCGHLDVGVPLEVRQLNCPALLSRQLIEGLGDTVLESEVPRLVLEVVARGGGALSLLDLTAAPGGERADGVDRPPVRLGKRNERNDPLEGSKRSGSFHRRRKISWVTSSASAVLLSTPPGNP